MSKTGFWLCAPYAAFILGCVAYAVFGGLDPESRFIFLQLPIALQSAIADGIGLLDILREISWVTAYVIFAGPIFVLLYLLGLAHDAIRTTTR